MDVGVGVGVGGSKKEKKLNRYYKYLHSLIVKATLLRAQ